MGAAYIDCWARSEGAGLSARLAPHMISSHQSHSHHHHEHHQQAPQRRTSPPSQPASPPHRSHLGRPSSSTRRRPPRPPSAPRLGLVHGRPLHVGLSDGTVVTYVNTNTISDRRGARPASAAAHAPHAARPRLVPIAKPQESVAGGRGTLRECSHRSSSPFVAVPLVVIAWVGLAARTSAAASRGRRRSNESADGAGVRRGGGLRGGVAREGQGEVPPGAPALDPARLDEAPEDRGRCRLERRRDPGSGHGRLRAAEGPDE